MDSENLFTNLPASFTTFIGYYSGLILLNNKNQHK